MARLIVRFCVVGLMIAQGGGIRDEKVEVNPPADFDAVQASPQGEAKTKGMTTTESKNKSQASVPQLGEEGKDPAGVPRLVEDAPKEERPDLNTSMQAVPQEEEIDEDEEEDEQEADEEQDTASVPELGEDAPKEDDLDPNTNNQALPSSNLERGTAKALNLDMPPPPYYQARRRRCYEGPGRRRDYRRRVCRN